MSFSIGSLGPVRSAILAVAGLAAVGSVTVLGVAAASGDDSRYSAVPASDHIAAVATSPSGTLPPAEATGAPHTYSATPSATSTPPAEATPSTPTLPPDVKADCDNAQLQELRDYYLRNNLPLPPEFQRPPECPAPATSASTLPPDVQANCDHAGLQEMRDFYEEKGWRLPPGFERPAACPSPS